MEDLTRAAVAFFAVIDPIGNIVVFQALAGEETARRRVLIATIALVVALALIVLFALAGEAALEFLDISPASFQIAAGVLLVLPALQMVEGRSVVGSGPRESGIDAAIVPLAVPLISGPGALALSASFAERIGPGVTLLAASIVLGLTWAAFIAAGLILQTVHRVVVRAATRLMGVVLMALAVDFVVSGWQSLP